MADGLEVLCQQAQRAQSVVDLHVLKHKTVSVEYIFNLFDVLVKPILTYGSEVYGLYNSAAVETFYLKFLKRLLNVKQSTNTCMVYAETGRYPLSIDIKVNMVKQWLKIVCSDQRKLIWIAYDNMVNATRHEKNWASHIKHLLYSTGFGFVWEQQSVNDTKQFVVTFKQRCKDIYTQTCFSEIEKSNRCRLYGVIKEVHDTEFYLRQQCNCHLRQGLSKIRLSSHKFFVERGRWSKPKVEYIERLCTLCDQRDIEDEYHILMTCPHYLDLRVKFIKKQYYVRPSMHKFQKLLNTTCKRELFRLMTFIKFVFKDYNNRLTCS